jgi:acyl carrier protein
MSRDEIYATLVDLLAESFELNKAEIKRESKLYEELGLDSIDAVDIFVQLREITGRRPDPARAREVRTIDDLITFVEEEPEAKAKGLPEPDVSGPPDPRSIASNSSSTN